MEIRFKKIDKILFLTLLLLVVFLYVVYIAGVHNASAKRTKERIGVFYSIKINDTIKRIDYGYNDSCSRSFWIGNDHFDYVEVDACQFPGLQRVKVGDVLQKNTNSKHTTFLHTDGTQTILALQIKH